MRRTFMATLFVALAAGGANTLSAQGRDRGLVELSDRPVRSGFYLTGALGAGREQCKFETSPCAILDANGSEIPVSGDGYRKATTSPAFAIRVGGTPNANLRIGGELFGWSANNGPATERTVGLLADAQVYPAARSGFYVKGGLGYGWSSYLQPGYETQTETGFIFNVGAGYDIPVGRGVQVAPMVDFYQGSYPGGVGAETLTERILFFGASLTLQSGRRR